MPGGHDPLALSWFAPTLATILFYVFVIELRLRTLLFACVNN